MFMCVLYRWYGRVYLYTLLYYCMYVHPSIHRHPARQPCTICTICTVCTVCTILHCACLLSVLSSVQWMVCSVCSVCSALPYPPIFSNSTSVCSVVQTEGATQQDGMGNRRRDANPISSSHHPLSPTIHDHLYIHNHKQPYKSIHNPSIQNIKSHSHKYLPTCLLLTVSYSPNVLSHPPLIKAYIALFLTYLFPIQPTPNTLTIPITIANSPAYTLHSPFTLHHPPDTPSISYPFLLFPNSFPSSLLLPRIFPNLALYRPASFASLPTHIHDLLTLHTLHTLLTRTHAHSHSHTLTYTPLHPYITIYTHLPLTHRSRT